MIRHISILAFFVIALTGCDEVDQPTIGDSGVTDYFPGGGSPPNITSFEPTEARRNDTLKIFGSGFHPNPDLNWVLMEGSTGVNVGVIKEPDTIFYAQPNELRVIVPRFDRTDSIYVWVSSVGSELWSTDSVRFRFRR